MKTKVAGKKVGTKPFVPYGDNSINWVVPGVAKVKYNPVGKVMYVQLVDEVKERGVSRSIEVSSGVILDFDSGGKVVGMEVLGNDGWTK